MNIPMSDKNSKKHFPQGSAFCFYFIHVGTEMEKMANCSRLLETNIKGLVIKKLIDICLKRSQIIEIRANNSEIRIRFKEN